MAFKIEDNDEAFHANQSIWMESDIDAIAQALKDEGVLSGCEVTAQGSPDMTVAVATGYVRVNGVRATVASGNVTIGAADGSNPRIDLIVVNSSGTKACTAGTAAANPKAPDIPANSVLLAMVYVPTSDTTIATNQITDKRCIVNGGTDAIQFIIDGGGSAITTGQKGHIAAPFACHIVGWDAYADQSGSIVVDVWKDTYANFPPTIADTITGSDLPTLSTAQKNQSTTLTGWTLTVAAGDVLAYNVNSITTCTRVTVVLRVVRV